MNIKNIKIASRILFLLFTTCFILNSCIFDTKSGYGIRNCTNDTLLIELTESDTLDDEIYWDKDSKDTIEILQPDDTTGIHVRGEKVVLWKCYYALPDSVLGFGPNLSDLKDTCYIYAIKWQVVTHYTLDEIRKKKLYDRQAITDKDFHKRLFEYKPGNSAGDF